MSETNQLLAAAVQGDKDARQRLDTQVYDELRQMAAVFLSQESPGHTLRPTALVHEAFLKLVDQRESSWHSRTHFFAIAAQAMRRILVDHARSRGRIKRGGGRQRISLNEELVINRDSDTDLLAVDEALNHLAELDSRQALIIEMRFFAGMTVAEVAEALSLSKRTVEREWTVARAWLRQQLSEDDAP